MLSEMFWTFLVATIAGLAFGMVKVCLKSKCEDVKLCCLTIHRNIKAEEAEYKLDIENGIVKPSSGQFDI